MENILTCPVHSFETLGTVDGPGIRFVIFTQGCNLKCKYCQNRDTWNCNGGTEYTVEEIVEKINKYKNYLKISGGGITISGGEPLLHIDFLIELFIELKSLGYNTAIDTSGSIPLSSSLKKLIELTDLFLLDIKCINDEVCKKLTGVSNKNELEFARYLSENGKHIWLRQVLVPGYTDNEKDLEDLKKFILKLNNIDKIEILPYHTIGKYKWEKCCDEYCLNDVREANLNDINRAKKILNIEGW